MGDFEFKYDKKTEMATIEGVKYSKGFFKSLRKVFDGEYSMILNGRKGNGIAVVNLDCIDADIFVSLKVSSAYMEQLRSMILKSKLSD